MSPWWATARAWEFISHRSGARFGARAPAAAITGFSTPTQGQQAFGVFQSDWRSLLQWLRLNARALAHSSMTKAKRRIFSEEFFGHAICRGKLTTCSR